VHGRATFDSDGLCDARCGERGNCGGQIPPIDHHGEVVEQVGRNSIRVRLPFSPKFVGTEPWQDGGGQVFSGPMVMGFADTAMYCCVMAAFGAGVIPVMANINITFLRPTRATDLIAEARIDVTCAQGSVSPADVSQHSR
jgi:acyl-coenzyme A thioesterase PaaI-like protein